MTSHYLKQWWYELLTHICVTRPWTSSPKQSNMHDIGTWGQQPFIWTNVGIHLRTRPVSKTGWRIAFLKSDPGPQFNIKMISYQYRKSHCGDKTILRPSYLHNGISYTGKMTSLYWIKAQIFQGTLERCLYQSIHHGIQHFDKSHPKSITIDFDELLFSHVLCQEKVKPKEVGFLEIFCEHDDKMHRSYV